MIKLFHFVSNINSIPTRDNIIVLRISLDIFITKTIDIL